MNVSNEITGSNVVALGKESDKSGNETELVQVLSSTRLSLKSVVSKIKVCSLVSFSFVNISIAECYLSV